MLLQRAEIGLLHGWHVVVFVESPSTVSLALAFGARVHQSNYASLLLLASRCDFVKTRMISRSAG